ncbi:MAG: hydrogenase maturation nickel metallochaperone HypA [Thermoplasmata archaeon]
MHEERLLRDLRRSLEEIAARERLPRILRVRLWIGALAHVSEDALRARWEFVVRGTAAEGSALEVEISENIGDPHADRLRLVRVVGEDASPSPGDRVGSGETIKAGVRSGSRGR